LVFVLTSLYRSSTNHLDQLTTQQPIMSPLRIATRGSHLALWQARHVADLLRQLGGSRPIEIVELETSGDKNRTAPLGQIGGEGLFTKEIQRAVLDGQADVAVHSLKDLPTSSIAGLCLAAVPGRGPAGDAFVSERYQTFDGLPKAARLGTSSTRRRAQLLHRRPDLQIVPVRGNVETRLHKLADQDLAGVVLAQAGLERLGLAERITEVLDQSWMLPAVSQGALGVECRLEDAATRNLVEKLNDSPTRAAVTAERALLRELEAGCQVPLGAFATLAGQNLALRAAVLDQEGCRRIEAQVVGSLDDAEEVGRELAAQLRSLGADKLLQSRA
jgi:hydroxymethylbilane synthase